MESIKQYVKTKHLNKAINITYFLNSKFLTTDCFSEKSYSSNLIMPTRYTKARKVR